VSFVQPKQLNPFGSVRSMWVLLKEGNLTSWVTVSLSRTLLHRFQVPSKVFALLHINVTGDQLQPCNDPFSDGVRTLRQQCWCLHIQICILSVASWHKETKRNHKVQGLEHRRMWKVLLVSGLQHILNIRMVMRHCIVLKQDTMLQQLCRFSMKERSHTITQV
jgi:hypothetical protein